MIGTGTGIAPFMAFMEERAADKRNQYADWHLFFGCRDEREFLYKDEIQKWELEGAVNTHIAYSRGNKEAEKYVQDLLEKEGDLVVSLLLRQDTHVLICGHAAMAEYCRERVIDLLRMKAQMSKITATNFLSSMRISNRWQLDVYGPGNTKGKNSKKDEFRVSTLPKLGFSMMKWIGGEDDD
jgi:sulfite reductase alpha subunit-like flavoprotein